MNSLSYRTTDDNGLSFVLLVDGTPLGELVGARDWALPLWYFTDEFPHLADDAGGTPGHRVVCCCSCGISDCGSTTCLIIETESEIVFQDFDSDVNQEGSKQSFRFAAENYCAVMVEILEHARMFGSVQDASTA